MEGVYYEDELKNLPVEEPQDEEQTVSLGKPYLNIADLNRGDPEREMTLLEWLDYLSSEYNMEELLGVLSYYVDLGWISEEVRSKLISYIRGFETKKKNKSLSEIQMGDKEYDLGNENDGEESSNKEMDRQANLKEHMKSLLFIFRILKDKVPKKILEQMSERVGSSE